MHPLSSQIETAFSLGQLKQGPGVQLSSPVLSGEPTKSCFAKSCLLCLTWASDVKQTEALDKRKPLLWDQLCSKSQANPRLHYLRRYTKKPLSHTQHLLSRAMASAASHGSQLCFSAFAPESWFSYYSSLPLADIEIALESFPFPWLL